jgi:hypothetical protein
MKVIWIIIGIAFAYAMLVWVIASAVKRAVKKLFTRKREFWTPIEFEPEEHIYW